LPNPSLAELVPEAWPTRSELLEAFDRPAELLERASHELEHTGSIAVRLGDEIDEPQH
jgi:hypothetical protein